MEELYRGLGGYDRGDEYRLCALARDPGRFEVIPRLFFDDALGRDTRRVEVEATRGEF